MKNDGGPAFPVRQEQRQHVSGNIYMVTPGEQPGMSMRDYFAAAALPYAAQFAEDEECHEYPKPERVAEYCFSIADAMLAERSK